MNADFAGALGMYTRFMRPELTRAMRRNHCLIFARRSMIEIPPMLPKHWAVSSRRLIARRIRCEKRGNSSTDQETLDHVWSFHKSSTATWWLEIRHPG